MKSFFIAMAIFAVLVISGIVFNSCLDNTAKTLLESCDKVEKAVETDDFEGAYNGAEAISEYIDSKKPLLSSILDHGNIDEIEEEISDLLGYTKKQDSVNSTVSLKELKHMLQHLPENYELRLQNIL